MSASELEKQIDKQKVIFESCEGELGKFAIVEKNNFEEKGRFFRLDFQSASIRLCLCVRRQQVEYANKCTD